MKLYQRVIHIYFEVTTYTQSILEKMYFDAIKNQKNSRLKKIVFWYPKILYVKNELGLTGLMQAVASRNYEAIGMLLKSGIDPDVMDQDGWTAKAWAILMNDYEAMRQLSSIGILTHSSQNNLLGISLVAIGNNYSDNTLSN